MQNAKCKIQERKKEIHVPLLLVMLARIQSSEHDENSDDLLNPYMYEIAKPLISSSLEGNELTREFSCFRRIEKKSDVLTIRSNQQAKSRIK